MATAALLFDTLRGGAALSRRIAMRSEIASAPADIAGAASRCSFSIHNATHMADGHSDARIMKHLLPDSLRRTFIEHFPLHSQEEIPFGEKKVVAKFFFPAGRYTFYVTEGEPEDDDFVFFGYCLSAVCEDFDEWGYVNLSELMSDRLGLLHMERDIHFPVATKTIAEVWPKADFTKAHQEA